MITAPGLWVTKGRPSVTSAWKAEPAKEGPPKGSRNWEERSFYCQRRRVKVTVERIPLPLSLLSNRLVAPTIGQSQAETRHRGSPGNAAHKGSASWAQSRAMKEDIGLSWGQRQRENDQAPCWVLCILVYIPMREVPFPSFYRRKNRGTQFQPRLSLL